MNGQQWLVGLAIVCEAGATFCGFTGKDPGWRGLVPLGIVFALIALAIPR